MKKQVKFRVNGQEWEIIVEPRQTLLDSLRYDIGLTGTKEGCSNGNCGSCTVLLDGQPVNSCLVFAVEVEGRDIHYRGFISGRVTPSSTASFY